MIAGVSTASWNFAENMIGSRRSSSHEIQIHTPATPSGRWPDLLLHVSLLCRHGGGNADQHSNRFSYPDGKRELGGRERQCFSPLHQRRAASCVVVLRAVLHST